MMTLLFFLSFAHADNSPVEIIVPLHRSYVPIGFDDNDNVQVTVEGIFADTCHKIASSTPSVSGNLITIRQTAYRYGGICLSMLIPFTSTVDLGFLAPGMYAIIDDATGANLGELPVARSTTSAADDYLYAPIADAWVLASVGQRTLVLTGSFSDRCTTMGEVKVSYSERVIIIQPIAQRHTSRDCMGKTRFRKEIALKTALEGVYLLHVRSMEGRAVNKMVDITDP